MNNNDAMASFLSMSSNAANTNTSSNTTKTKSQGKSDKANEPDKVTFNKHGAYDDQWLEEALKGAGVTFTTKVKQGTVYYNVPCPNESEHTSESTISSASCWIWNGYPVFKCQHSHCADWKFADYAAAVGIDYKGTGSVPGTTDESGEVTHYYSHFYSFNQSGEPNKTLDSIIAKWVRDNYTFFYMGDEVFFYEEGRYVRDDYGKMKNIIQSCIVPSLCKDSTINGIHRMIAYQQGVSRTYNDLNQYPAHWVAFKNCMFDPITGETHPHSPDYYCVNQIPYDYDPDADVSCPTYDNLIRFQMPDEDAREMWLEFGGLCFTRDMRFQKFMFLKGRGGTGKSVQLNTLQHCLGSDNVSNETIHNLTQRFNATNVFGKLANVCADVSSADIQQVDVIKRITGADKGGLKHERKGKDSFPFNPFCKLLFSANKMPRNKDEKSNAWYRRLLIVCVDAQPTEVDELLESKLEAETLGIIHVYMAALKRLYQRGHFIVSKESERETRKLRCETDTVIAFIDECCTFGADLSIERKKLYDAYLKYCESEKLKFPTSKRAFYEQVRAEGATEVKENGYDFFRGIRPLEYNGTMD